MLRTGSRSASRGGRRSKEVAGSVAHSRPPYFLVCQHQRRVSDLCTPRTPRPPCGCRNSVGVLIRTSPEPTRSLPPLVLPNPGPRGCSKSSGRLPGTSSLVDARMRFSAPTRQSLRRCAGSRRRRADATTSWGPRHVGQSRHPDVTFTASFPRTRPSPTAAPGPAQLHPDGSSSSWPRALLAGSCRSRCGCGGG